MSRAVLEALREVSEGLPHSIRVWREFRGLARECCSDDRGVFERMLAINENSAGAFALIDTLGNAEPSCSCATPSSHR